MADEETIQEMYRKARKAFEQIEHCSQEYADLMAQAAGWEWSKPEVAKELARLAVDESGIGVYEDKVAKVQAKTRGSMRDLKGAKTAGIVEEIPKTGIIKIAKPIGVIANVVPCTNPESTVCALGVNILKTRNAMIVTPHPRTQMSTYAAVEHGRKALARIGAPVNLLQCIRHTSKEKTRELMAHCDFAIATGGAALVRVVYEAGKPCHTVGAGNVVSVVDSTADLAAAAKKIVKSKTANNSASCSSENAVALEACVYDKMLACLQAEGGYLCTTEEREKLRQYYWPDGKELNRDVVAKPVAYLAEKAGIAIPKGTRFLMVIGEKVGPEDRFSGEKVSLVLTVWKWTDFDEIIGRIERILEFSGIGHSASIHSELPERHLKMALRLKVGRVNCNMPHAAANSGSWFNGQPTTDSLGCGTWAGNMTSDNINWRHFLNYTWLSRPVPEYIPPDEELFGEYLAKYGRD